MLNNSAEMLRQLDAPPHYGRMRPLSPQLEKPNEEFGPLLSLLATSGHNLSKGTCSKIVPSLASRENCRVFHNDARRVAEIERIPDLRIMVAQEEDRHTLAV